LTRPVGEPKVSQRDSGSVGDAQKEERWKYEAPTSMSGKPLRMSTAREEPAITPPPGACDCHCHVFGAEGVYPTVALDDYAPPVGPLDAYLAMAGDLGFERSVFVQPVTYGSDSSCVLDALREVGSETARGIGGIPDKNVGEATLAEWHRLGLRGLRVNYTPYKPYEAGFADAVLPDVARAAALVHELGWMLDIMTPNWLTMELLPHLNRMRVRFTLGHFGKLPAKNGTDHPDFRKLLGYLRDGESGCHVKIAAAYQVSDAPGFGDVAPMARALYEAAPSRVIWGTDWPHIRHEAHGNAPDLLALFGVWFPDIDDQRQILTDNPARLFGFSTAAAIGDRSAVQIGH
jgi:predicted TIM-barrel fold metal-dependent hydrolase